MYTERLLEEFYNPTNVGVIKGADAVGKVKDRTCGDIIKIYIAVENDTIVDVKFQTYGSTVAIAASSLATKLIMGKTFDEVYTITSGQIKSELGGNIPANKNYAINLVEEAIHLAINNYFEKTLGYIPDKFKVGNITNSDELEQNNEEQKDEKEKSEKTEKKSLKIKVKPAIVEDDDDSDDEEDVNDDSVDKMVAEIKAKEVVSKDEDDKNAIVVNEKTNNGPSRTVTKTLEVYTKDIDDMDDEDQIFNSIDNLTSTLSDALKKLNEENKE